MKTTASICAIAALSAGLCAAQDTSRFSFEGGIGPALPMGGAGDRLNTGFSLLAGAGWKFNPKISAMLEFQYDRFSLTTGSLEAFNQPDGFNRFWGLSLSPRYYFHLNKRIGGYGTAGYGLYANTLAFTDPSQAQGYCDPYYGCYSTGAPVIASETTYHGGYNAGGGLTYALGDGDFRIVMDARYNRLLSHANNEFVTLSFGFVF